MCSGLCHGVLPSFITDFDICELLCRRAAPAILFNQLLYCILELFARYSFYEDTYLQIAPLQSSSCKVSAPLRSVLNVCHWHTAPPNIRNPLIYCVNRYYLHSVSVGAKQTFTGCSASHIWRGPSSKVLSCKHERLFELLPLVSIE